uniref:Solute-binding protein family 3/N-terminal domain-containing protein n=1 Tax=Plectus sambesii TaxID=2011161 RepID=A0A914VMR8_9BILA
MTSKSYIPFVYTTLGVVLLLCHPMNAMLDPEFANISLRIAISVWPPLAFNCSAFPTLVPTRECPFPGFDAENLGIILAHMGITNYSFYVFDKRVTTSGAYVDGTWTNIMGMIMNETVDTICGGYQRTETRSRDFDFAYPMLQIKPVFVVKKRVAGFVEAVMAVFSGFDGQVWLMICSVFAVQVVCIMFIDYVQLGDNHRKLGKWAPGKMVFNMYRLFIMQCDDELKHPTYTGNMLIVIFGIVDILLVSLYQGLLLTQLLYPIEVRPFKDADEMMQRIADKEYSLITYYPGHWYFQELQTSKGEHFVKMRVALRNNPAVIIANQSLVLDMVAAGKYILPIDTDGEVLYYAKHQYCDLTFIEDGN